MTVAAAARKFGAAQAALDAARAELEQAIAQAGFTVLHRHDAHDASFTVYHRTGAETDAVTGHASQMEVRTFADFAEDAA